MKTHIALLSVLAFTASAPAQSTMAPLLTRAWDNHRSGWNQQETVLTQANVKAKGIARITTIPVFGDARGMESQPLILPGVKLADGTTHDIMILPSMANIVRGVDATTGAALWQTPPLGTPITGQRLPRPQRARRHVPRAESNHRLLPDQRQMGRSLHRRRRSRYVPRLPRCLGLAQRHAAKRQALYVRPQREGRNPGHRAGPHRWFQRLANLVGLHAQAAQLAGDDEHQRTQDYLLRLRHHSGTRQPAPQAGCSPTTLPPTRSPRRLPTTQGFGGGIWMGGQGLAADSQGYLYAVTGNGSFDGVNDFAESILKIQYTPPSGPTPASLKIVSWFTPYSDTARSPAAIPARHPRRPSNLQASARRLKPSGPSTPP